jgi:hypothetical protein
MTSETCVFATMMRCLTVKFDAISAIAAISSAIQAETLANMEYYVGLSPGGGKPISVSSVVFFAPKKVL